MGFLKWLFGPDDEVNQTKVKPRSLLQVINDQIAIEQRIKNDQAKIHEEMTARGRQFGEALLETHAYLTDEKKPPKKVYRLLLKN